MSTEIVQRLPLFAGLTEADLERLHRMARTIEVPAGETIIREGEMGDSLYVILEGELEITKRRGGQDVVLAVRRAGEYIGEMSLIEQSPRTASARTLQRSRLLVISQAAFQALLATSPTAQLSVLRTMTSRLQSTQSLLMQHEKMAALGTLAAGLAHELNNPAAALRRSADLLRSAIERRDQIVASLGPLNEEQIAAMARAMGAHESGGASDSLRDPLALSEREDAIWEWLRKNEVEHPGEIAPTLADAGWTVAELEQALAAFPPNRWREVVPWLAARHMASALLDEIIRAAAAISEVVQAIKTYSYLGQAPIQEVDVRETLENTLVILKHKLKHGITVTRDYAEDLPRIEAYASELNQVWTNIVDNAIQAMNGTGSLTLRVRHRNREEVNVEICDSGPGIPPEVQDRIFDPFFTTKEPGIGTGLGLSIVYNIVVDKHHGRIRVDSEPGRTCFHICLPVRLSEELRDTPPVDDEGNEIPATCP